MVELLENKMGYYSVDMSASLMDILLVYMTANLSDVMSVFLSFDKLE